MSSNPAYDADDAVVPPTFLVTAQAFWAGPTDDALADIDFDLARLLHGEEEYVFHGPPPRAGETLSVRRRIERRWEREGKRGGTMRFAAVVNEFRDGTGRVVAEQRSTLIETARPATADS
jgi:hypothetical protein